MRVVPVAQRLAAVLEMLRTDPTRAELHDVRDFLGHTNITTTSRYLRSTTLRLERALTFLEQHEQQQADSIDAQQLGQEGFQIHCHILATRGFQRLGG